MKIGYLQLHNTADIKSNILRIADGIRNLAERGPNSFVRKNRPNSLFFCKFRAVDTLDLAARIPGPSPDFFGAVARG